MDNENYEQISISNEVVGNFKNFIIESMQVQVNFYKGLPIGLTLPNFVNLEVKETSPGERGNTVTGATKVAILSTGYSVNVPLFINEGDSLKIDTRNGEYVERVKF